MYDLYAVHVLQLSQLKLELRNAIHTHGWKPDSYLVAKSYVPANNPSLPEQSHRIPLKPTTKKLYVFLQSCCLI